MSRWMLWAMVLDLVVGVLGLLVAALMPLLYQPQGLPLRVYQWGLTITLCAVVGAFALIVIDLLIETAAQTGP